MTTHIYSLYPEITPYQNGYFSASDQHEIYYELCGNPDGTPVVFLHGGPGSGCNPAQRRFFDPTHYRIILLDQRGCGKSRPMGSTIENTTKDLVADLEQLRTLLHIERWQVFGGSWGSTLALAYAISHPERVSALVLRGIFLSRPEEIRWFLHDVKNFFPDNYEKILSHIGEAERDDVLKAYAARIFSDDPDINLPAAIIWNNYEGNMMSLLPAKPSDNAIDPAIHLARARIQIHYILHECFVGERDLLSEAKALAHIPTAIIQGRYDMVCPPRSAWQLKQAMPHAILHLIADAGHSGMEAGTISALVSATEDFKRIT